MVMNPDHPAYSDDALDETNSPIYRCRHGRFLEEDCEDCEREDVEPDDYDPVDDAEDGEEE